MSIIKPFEQQGNFTQIHNVVFDVIMAQVKPTSFKVLMAIIRKTVGWHKEEDRISFSQLQQITGIKSVDTIYLAIEELSGMGIIKFTSGDHSTPTLYALNKDYKIEQEDVGLPKNGRPVFQKMEDGGLPKNGSTKESLLNKSKEERESAPLEKFINHFKELGQAFESPQIQGAIVASLKRYDYQIVIDAYESAVLSGAQNIPAWANKILMTGGIKVEPYQQKENKQNGQYRGNSNQTNSKSKRRGRISITPEEWDAELAAL